jgi:hypothetical protein
LEKAEDRRQDTEYLNIEQGMSNVEVEVGGLVAHSTALRTASVGWFLDRITGLTKMNYHVDPVIPSNNCEVEKTNPKPGVSRKS